MDVDRNICVCDADRAKLQLSGTETEPRLRELVSVLECVVLIVDERTGKSRLMRAGFKGAADVTGQMTDGRRLEIEVKRPDHNGVPSEDQGAFLLRVEGNGGVAGVARSVEEALAIIEGRKRFGGSSEPPGFQLRRPERRRATSDSSADAG